MIGASCLELFSRFTYLYFFISGIFFKRKEKFQALFFNKANRLLKPYFLVSFGLLLFNFIYKRTFSFNELGSIFYASGATITWTPLWFLSHLFVVALFSWLINHVLNLFKHNLLKIVLLLIIIIFGAKNIGYFNDVHINLPLTNYIWGNSNDYYGLPFNIDIILVTSLIFLMGHLLADYFLDFKINYFYFF